MKTIFWVFSVGNDKLRLIVKADNESEAYAEIKKTLGDTFVTPVLLKKLDQWMDQVK